MEKISFITTVKNSEGVAMLLSSLSVQTRMPDEIVIAVAGSDLETTILLNEYKKIFKKKKVPFMVLENAGNRAQGRNLAINAATYSIIAVSDAGCVLDKNWLAYISKPFIYDQIHVVSGFYKPAYDNVFERCVATYTCVMPDKLHDDFLPSSRSVAFRKSAWRDVNGYPEYLNTCEDLVFARSMRQKGLQFVLAKNAVVTWPQETSLRAVAKQLYRYAQGDGQALYIRPQTPLLFLRYMVGLFLLIYGFTYQLAWYMLVTGFLFYVIWSIAKNYRYVQHGAAIVYLPLLQLTSDIAVMCGMIVGYAKRI